jgi:hypothetical protein
MFGLSLECHPITNFEPLSHCFATKERALLTDLSVLLFFLPFQGLVCWDLLSITGQDFWKFISRISNYEDNDLFFFVFFMRKKVVAIESLS